MIEWRVISEAADYEVSNDGLVRRLTPAMHTRPGRVIFRRLNHAGYYRVALALGPGRQITRRVARLVAAVFLGPCQIGFEVNHKDGNKQNDCVENLEYVTRGENVRHAFATGLLVRSKGEQSPLAKLTAAQAVEIRATYRRYHRGYSSSDLAAKYGVSAGTIRNVVHGATYPVGA